MLLNRCSVLWSQRQNFACRFSRTFASRAKKPLAKRSGPLLGLFGDIHFQDKGLNRIVAAGDWIIDSFHKRKVDAVVCLGGSGWCCSCVFFMLSHTTATDVLNTREQVSVRALSSAMQFFDKMAAKLGVPIHILLGNHDMNLKNSSKVSSLDALSTQSMHKGGLFHLHRDIDLVSVCGQQSLMIPYHEDVTSIVRCLEDVQGQHSASSIVAFGHLALNGAIQNGSSSYRYQGALPPSAFSGFRRTFSGHFHVHQTLSHNVTYVGAPLQFNFGDAGADRGIVIFDAGENEWNFVVNPHCHQYFKIAERDLNHLIETQPGMFQDSYVTIYYSGAKLSMEHHERMKDRLLLLGANAVYKENDVVASLRESGEQLASKLGRQQNIEEQIELYAQSVRQIFADKAKPPVSRRKTIKSAESISKWDHFLLAQDKFTKLVDYGLKVVRDTKLAADSAATTGTTFDGRLARLTLTNFMGVVGTIEISFQDKPRGIWLIDGENGAGKSTIYEAIVWCQFGEFLRSGMQKDYAINDQEQQCSVVLEFENGFIIERNRKRGRSETIKTFQRNSSGDAIYLEHNELGELRNTQKRINDLLGIDFDTFSKSVVMGQNIFANFVSGSKEQRRTIIEEMLGLDRFNLYFDSVKQERQIVQKSVDTLLSQIQSLEMRRAELDHELILVNQKQAQAASQQLSRLNLKRDAEKRRASGLERLLLRKQRALDQKTSLESELKSAKERVDKIDLNQAAIFIAELRSKEKHLQVIGVGNSECPTCGQSVTPTHTNKMANEALLLLKQVSTAFPELFSALLSVNSSDAPSIRNLCSHFQRELANFVTTSTKQAETLAAELKQQEVSIVQAENEILRFENQFVLETQELVADVASHDAVAVEQNSMRKQIEQAILEVSTELAGCEDRRSKLEETFSIRSRSCSYILRFWELAFDKQSKTSVGFSTIRSFIFEDLVIELNSIIDTYVEQLSNKAPLRVTLTSDLDIEELYGKRSGGERKRTDLAVLFSLFEIVRDRSRFRPNFIMLDEVFDALDKAGRVTVGHVLMALSRRVDNVFVITHTDLATGMSLAGTITARMQFKGTKPCGTMIDIHTL